MFLAERVKLSGPLRARLDLAALVQGTQSVKVYTAQILKSCQNFTLDSPMDTTTQAHMYHAGLKGQCEETAADLGQPWYAQ